MILWNDDDEYPSQTFSYNPGDLYYQYYDGYYINFTFVNQLNNTFQVIKFPLCEDRDVYPESYYVGFANSVEGSTFSVTIENMQVRYEGANMTCYGGFDVTGLVNNVTLPNSHVVNLYSDGNATINGFTNGYLVEPGPGVDPVFQYGKEIILFNENNNPVTSLTFNNMNGDSNDGNRIWIGNNESSLLLWPGGNARFIYVPSFLSMFGVWKLLSYVQGAVPPL
jgi:hypothetical protein